MLRSMTAYGRASVALPLGLFIVEIQSVNRKHLEINVLLPKELARFEGEVKKILGSHLFRGQITVKIFATFEETTPLVVSVNLPLVRQLKAAWDRVAKELHLERDQQAFDLNVLMSQPGVLLYNENLQDEGEYRKAIELATKDAVVKLIEMKEREGASLQEDIASRLQQLGNCIDQISSKTSGATLKYRQRLVDRLEEVLSGCVENEERILREVSVYAERIDIVEEVTRFNSHLKQLSGLLLSETKGIGKTLEFIVQELHREINTIGSKSSDMEISRLVITVKSDLERIREQIQNIE